MWYGTLPALLGTFNPRKHPLTVLARQVGTRVVLLPFREQFAETYMRWMQDPFIRGTTITIYPPDRSKRTHQDRTMKK